MVSQVRNRILYCTWLKQSFTCVALQFEAQLLTHLKVGDCSSISFIFESARMTLTVRAELALQNNIKNLQIDVSGFHTESGDRLSLPLLCTEKQCVLVHKIPDLAQTSEVEFVHLQD